MLAFPCHCRDGEMGELCKPKLVRIVPSIIFFPSLKSSQNCSLSSKGRCPSKIIFILTEWSYFLKQRLSNCGLQPDAEVGCKFCPLSLPSVHLVQNWSWTNTTRACLWNVSQLWKLSQCHWPNMAFMGLRHGSGTDFWVQNANRREWLKVTSGAIWSLWRPVQCWGGCQSVVTALVSLKTAALNCSVMHRNTSAT